MAQSSVRFIGSRELHRDLPKVLESLEESSSTRYVLTIHNKPKAVLIGAEAFLELLRGRTRADRLLALQLEALSQGLEDGDDPQAKPSRKRVEKKAEKPVEELVEIAG
jgi:hypothetical protein